MTEFKVRCYKTNSTGDSIGAEVIIYDGDDVIDTITLVDQTRLDELISRLDNLDSTYIDVNELKEILTNSLRNNTINATLLNGLASDKFLKIEQIPNYTFNPKAHTSTTAEYGLGTNSVFGHVKTIDNLNSETFRNGEALSARQGYELDSRITLLEEDVKKNNIRILISRKSDGAGETGTQIVVTHGTSNGIVARIDCDDSDYELSGRTIRFLINGVMYDRTTDSQGKTGAVTINLDPGNYLVTALMSGYEGKNPISEQKFLIVE